MRKDIFWIPSQILEKKNSNKTNSKMLTLTSKLKEFLYDTHLCYEPASSISHNATLTQLIIMSKRIIAGFRENIHLLKHTVKEPAGDVRSLQLPTGLLLGGDSAVKLLSWCPHDGELCLSGKHTHTHTTHPFSSQLTHWNHSGFWCSVNQRSNNIIILIRLIRLFVKPQSTV